MWTKVPLLVPMEVGTIPLFLGVFIVPDENLGESNDSEIAKKKAHADFVPLFVPQLLEALLKVIYCEQSTADAHAAADDAAAAAAKKTNIR